MAQGSPIEPAPLEASLAASTGEADSEPSSTPQHPRAVLAALIAVAAVANLNLSVANVALPDIGKAFDASQTGLDLVAVGFSLGLAASVLYLGALGDRYGRRMMLLLGTALAIPTSLLAALAPSITVLFIGTSAGGRVGRYGLPDNARADHRAVVGCGAHPLDRVVVGPGRQHVGAWAAR